MTSDYSDYINKATGRLVELLSSNTIRQAEKERYITSLSEALTRNVFSSEKIESYNVLFAKESILFIDDLLTKYNAMQPLETYQLDDAILLCERQMQNIAFFNTEKIPMPAIKISNVEQFSDSIKLNYDNNSFLKMTLQLDRLITESCQKMTSYSDEECNYVFSLLNEMNKNISECSRRGIDYSEVSNADTEKIKAEIISNRTKLENDAYFSKTYSLDSKISQIIDGPGRYDETKLAQALILLDELEPRIIECRTRSINIDKLKNKNINDTRRKIADYKQAIVDRNGLYGEITGLDNRIVNACNMWHSDPNQLSIIVELCDKCALLINEYKNRGWKVPALKCINPIDTKNKYLLYDEMIKTDKIISAQVTDLSKDKQKSFLDNVNRQKSYVMSCSQNNWAIPNLLVKDLDRAIKDHNRLLSKNRRKITAVIVSALVVAFFVITTISALALHHRYLETHTKMPISLSSSLGDNYLDVVEELEDAGFKNVEIQSVSSGILKSGMVTEITVNGMKSFVQNSYYPTNAEIIVYFSSKNRVDITSSLSDWEKTTVDDLYNSLRGQRFDVKREEVSNSIMKNNNMIESIIVNGVEYTSGDCFVPKDAEIILRYYGEACRLEDDAEDLIGENYKKVKRILTKLGFDNIVFKRKDDLVTGWFSKDGSVDSITINGKSDFKEGDVYFHNVEIVITVHTFKNQEYEDIDD